MEKNIVTQAVFCQWVVYVVASVCSPVVIEFLGAKYKHVAVTALIILHYR